MILVKKVAECLKLCLKKFFEELDSIFYRTSKPINEVDKYLKDTLIIFVEIYHFFEHQNNSKQKLSLDFKKKNSIYSKKNYWKNTVDLDTYMKNKILSSFYLILKVRVKFLLNLKFMYKSELFHTQRIPI